MQNLALLHLLQCPTEALYGLPLEKILHLMRRRPRVLIFQCSLSRLAFVVSSHQATMAVAINDWGTGGVVALSRPLPSRILLENYDNLAYSYSNSYSK